MTLACLVSFAALLRQAPWSARQETPVPAAVKACGFPSIGFRQPFNKNRFAHF